MFNASSSKSNSSTKGTLHFTRQPRSFEVVPTLTQFHFQTSVSSITVPVHHLYFTSDVLKMIVCELKSNECYQESVSDWWESVSSKIVFVQFVPVFAQIPLIKQHSINRCFTGHQVTLLKRLCCCRASWGNQSCLCRDNARVYQVQVLIILSWRWSQCHTSTMSK